VTRVFLIAASARERLEDLVDAAGAQIVGSSADFQALDSELLENAQVILIDASSEPPDELLEALREQGILRETQVILVNAPRLQPWINQALRAGVGAILHHELTATQLGKALEAVAEGLIVLHSNETQPPFASRATDSDITGSVEALTAREREVLQMLAQGHGNKDIAARLKISEHTVKFHVASILGKLGASTRTEAVSIALRRGVILL
jgi:two-component system, NarL family, response regulator YdfI